MPTRNHSNPIHADAAKQSAKRIKERMSELGYDAPLSHAYQVLAANYGHSNWAAMKATLDKASSSKPSFPEDSGKVVWNDELERAYTGLSDWIVNFQFTAEVLGTMLENDGVPEEIKAFSKILFDASVRLTETEQAMTILHEIAVSRP